MGWKDLLQKNDETLVLPWLGGRSLRSGPRTWTIEGRLPREQGWHKFTVQGRKASWVTLNDTPAFEVLRHIVRGYLVGDRLVLDDARVDPDPKTIAHHSEPVALLDPALDKFARVSAGRIADDCGLVYMGQEMPLGPEDDVLQAWLDEAGSVDQIKGVSPALDAAFRMETWRRVEAERRRQEIERLRIEEEAKRALEERRQNIVRQLGDAAGRREMAGIDFPAAARASLAVGGAVFLDARPAHRATEMVVRYRFLDRRFECTCDSRSMQIIDAGVCLTDEETGEKGDSYFTLESLPGVILQAHNEGRLVVFRHA
jgi:hypothetical protein